VLGTSREKLIFQKAFAGKIETIPASFLSLKPMLAEIFISN